MRIAQVNAAIATSGRQQNAARAEALNEENGDQTTP